ncbi:hypothetical protein E2C01_080639 [Portunus trituberculatus]|nr:hypothetical protein [Portunus trituberculatus]
MGAETR